MAKGKSAPSTAHVAPAAQRVAGKSAGRNAASAHMAAMGAPMPGGAACGPAELQMRATGPSGAKQTPKD